MFFSCIVFVLQYYFFLVDPRFLSICSVLQASCRKSWPRHSSRWLDLSSLFLLKLSSCFVCFDFSFVAFFLVLLFLFWLSSPCHSLNSSFVWRSFWNLKINFLTDLFHVSFLIFVIDWITYLPMTRKLILCFDWFSDVVFFVFEVL